MTPSTRSKAVSKSATAGRRVRPRRDLEAMTERRLRAGKMFAKGSSQADVARALEVSRVTASQWHATWSEHGLAGLRGAQRAGRLPKITDEQLEKVEEALAKGPGWRTFSLVTEWLESHSTSTSATRESSAMGSFRLRNSLEGCKGHRDSLAGSDPAIGDLCRCFVTVALFESGYSFWEKLPGLGDYGPLI